MATYRHVVAAMCPDGNADVGRFESRCVTSGRGRLTMAATARNAASFDAEGFFLSGDLGLIDADGRLRFQARLKEMVKTGGINVAPVEVEEVLASHPAVEQVHVVGLPDARREEVLAAIVVLRDGHDASEDDLRGHCRRALAAFKVPQHFRFLKRAELPVTATGKVQKVRLREALIADLGLA